MDNNIIFPRLIKIKQHEPKTCITGTKITYSYNIVQESDNKLNFKAGISINLENLYRLLQMDEWEINELFYYITHHIDWLQECSNKDNKNLDINTLQKFEYLNNKIKAIDKDQKLQHEQIHDWSDDQLEIERNYYNQQINEKNKIDRIESNKKQLIFYTECLEKAESGLDKDIQLIADLKRTINNIKLELSYDK